MAYTIKKLIDKDKKPTTTKKNTLFSIAGNFIFHLDISQSDKYQIFEKLYQTVDLSRIRKLDFSECLYSAIYKKIYLQWTGA